jgi:CRP/FNR family cyclic AMP-dependent transcriptional regulator
VSEAHVTGHNPPNVTTNATEHGAAQTPPVQTSTLSVDQTIELLGRVNLFNGLPTVYLRRIAAIGQTEVHERGARIFEEGAPGDKVYLILEGSVRISRQVPGMGEEALAVLKTHDYFGEMALIDDFPRSADAHAHERCQLFVITKDHLADLLFVDRDLAYDLLWNFVRTLAGRLRETNDKMTFLAVSSKF